MLKAFKFFFPMMMIEGGASGGPAAAPAAAAPAAPAAAAPAAPAAAAPAAPAAAPAAEWTSTYDEATKGYIANKGWKEPTHLLDSYRNLEKLVGASPDQVIKLPKADDPQAADAMNSIYDRLGRPKSPDGYKLEIPKETGSPEFAKAASEAFHKLGLSEKQGQDLAKWWNETQANYSKTANDQLVANVESGKANLKKEWGAAHDQNLGLAKRAAREFGVDAKVIDAIESVAGYDGVMKFFHTIGSKLGEPGFHSGGTPPGNGAMTPSQAKARIAELRTDPSFVKRYVANDSSARAEMDKLNRFAVGESA